MPQTTFSESWMANGNISPCRFVMIDTSVSFKAIQATANTKAFGISQVGTMDPPGVNGSTAYAAIAGSELQVFTVGAVTLLELPASGCTAGDFLGPDSDGKGVAVTIGGTDSYVCAQAEQTVSGAGFARVRVLSPFEMGT